MDGDYPFNVEVTGDSCGIDSKASSEKGFGPCHFQQIGSRGSCINEATYEFNNCNDILLSKTG